MPRRVLLICGAGRSGTSTLAGLVRILGVPVPLPEVPTDESNPRGFAEPQWLVDTHDRLLEAVDVQVADARPRAWSVTYEVAAREPVVAEATAWLSGHLDAHPEVVLKDPRLSWFLPLWREAAARTGAVPVFATMLRAPAEVVGSRQAHYAHTLGPAHLTASWVNALLHTESATRPHAVAGVTADGRAAGARVFVRYADLLTSAVTTIDAVTDRLGLQGPRQATPEQRARAVAFVDPTLRRTSADLADLALPRRLHELAADTWTALDRLAEPGGDVAAAHVVLDHLRVRYDELYGDAESIARSTAVAAELHGRRAAGVPDRRAADRVPHRVRALVPPGVRRGARALLRRPR